MTQEQFDNLKAGDKVWVWGRDGENDDALQVVVEPRKGFNGQIGIGACHRNGDIALYGEFLRAETTHLTILNCIQAQWLESLGRTTWLKALLEEEQRR